MNKQFKQKLRSAKTLPLSEEESTTVWRAVANALPARSARGMFYSLTYKPMYAIIVAIAVFVAGSGATVAAADSARPGDALFGLDVAVERVRLAVAGNEKKAELRAKFAAERAEEAEELIEEAEDVEEESVTETSASTDDNTNDTDATTTTTSTDDVDDEVDNEPSVRASFAAKNAIDRLAEVKIELEAKGNDVAANAIAETITRLETKLERLPENARARVFTDDEEIDVRIEKDKEEDYTKDESLEIEVTVRGGVAYISYEFGDKKAEYRTVFSSREDIIISIAEELDVSPERVENALKLKYEDNEDSDEETDIVVITDIEVTVRGDIAYVKVEYSNGRKLEYRTNFESRADIIISIADKLETTDERVENYLKLKYEDENDEDTDTDENNDSEDDDSDVINDIIKTITLRKIEVEIEGGAAKVEAKYSNGREEEFRIESATEAEMDAKIAEELGISVESAAELTAYKR